MAGCVFDAPLRYRRTVTRPQQEVMMAIGVFATVTILVTSLTDATSIPTFSYIGEPTSAAFINPDSRVVPVDGPWTKENYPRLADATEEANIAYFVQVSDSSLPLLPRLLSRLHHPENFYALHFDKKIPAYRVVKVVEKVKSNPFYKNVHIMERESVTYRGITMVLNNMAAITDLLKLGDWDYFINLSGSDYPLVSPIVQRRVLAMPHIRAKDYNFFTVSPKEQWDESKRFRFQQIAVDTALGFSEQPEDSNLVILNQRQPLLDALNYEYIKGEGWIMLTRKACEFMLTSAKSRKMLLSMAYSQEASEHFYVSLFWNDPTFNRTILTHSLRTVYWVLNGVPSGQHPYVIDNLLHEDGSFKLWPWLRASPHWFARKFSIPDSPILDWIDNEMSGLGNNPNETSIAESTSRMETHLHWLLGLNHEVLDQDAARKKIEETWPSR